jgi:hypothetical protein
MNVLSRFGSIVSGAFVGFGLLTLIGPAMHAQSSSQSSLELSASFLTWLLSNAEDSPPPQLEADGAGTRGDATSFIQWLLGANDETSPPQRDAGGTGSRGDDYCIVSLPPNEVEEIWNDRPVFLIQGSPRRLAIFEGDSDIPLWTYPANEQAAVVYSGPELEPGQVYTFRAQHVDFPNTIFESRQFQVVSAAERQAIAAELVTVSAAVAADGGSLADVAIARADYFWAQGLGADAWREIAVAQQLSPTAADAVEFAYTQLCNTSTQP